MPSDIRSFFGGGAKPSSQQTDEPARKKAAPKKTSRASRVVEDSDDNDEEEEQVQPPKTAPKKPPPKKVKREPTPELEETTTSAFFASTNKPKRSEPFKKNFAVSVHDLGDHKGLRSNPVVADRAIDLGKVHHGHFRPTEERTGLRFKFGLHTHFYGRFYDLFDA